MAKSDKKAKKDKKGKKGAEKAGNWTILDKDTNKIRLNNVRLSFPHIFSPQSADGDKPAKFNAALLLDNKEHADTIEFLQNLCKDLATKELKLKRLAKDKQFIRNGDEKSDIEGFEGCHSVSASNTRRPLALDRDKSALTEADGKLYPGCYCNVVIQCWAQNNKHGKRINASLEGIQFHDDGESLGGGAIADESDFS